MKQRERRLVVLLSFMLVILVWGNTVEAASKKPKLSSSNISIEVGKKKTIKLKNASKARWSVKNKKVVKITSKKNKQIQVKGNKKGTTYVYAKVDSKKLKCKITVIDKVSENQPSNTEEITTQEKTEPNTSQEYTVPTTETPTPNTNGGNTVIAPCKDNNHNWVANNRQESKCVEEGYIDYVCSKCKDTKRTAIAAKGHSVSNWETSLEPTCVKEGKKHGICTTCKSVVTEMIAIDPDAHKVVCNNDKHIESTCSTKGYDYYYCENSGCVYTDRRECELNPNVHTWVKGICSGCEKLIFDITATNVDVNELPNFYSKGTKLLENPKILSEEGISLEYIDENTYSVSMTVRGSYNYSSTSIVSYLLGNIQTFYIGDDNRYIVEYSDIKVEGNDCNAIVTVNVGNYSKCEDYIVYIPTKDIKDVRVSFTPDGEKHTVEFKLSYSIKLN